MGRNNQAERRLIPLLHRNRYPRHRRTGPSPRRPIFDPSVPEPSEIKRQADPRPDNKQEQSIQKNSSSFDFKQAQTIRRLQPTKNRSVY